MKLKTLILLVTLAAQGAAFAQALPLRASRTLSAGPSSADTHSTATASATTSSQGGSALGVGSQGQSLSIDSHAVYQAQSRNPVSTAVATPLISSNDTCMGSTSIGGSAVSFGFSAGTTWTDDNCVMLKNAREIWNMGFKGAALARLCMDNLNKEAFEATGINCPPRRAKDKAPVVETVNARDDMYRY